MRLLFLKKRGAAKQVVVLRDVIHRCVRTCYGNYTRDPIFIRYTRAACGHSRHAL